MQWTVDNILIPHFMALGLNASGEWVNSLKVRDDNGEGIISGRKYTEQLVYGRRPNQDQTHKGKAKWAYGMANFNDKFIQWLQIRGLTDYGFQIAYKIADEGTNIYKDGGTDLIEILEKPETQRRISEHMQGLYAVQVKNFLEREIQQAWQR